MSAIFLHMVRALRSTALLLTFVALQLTLLGGAAACAQVARPQTERLATPGPTVVHRAVMATEHDCDAPQGESQSPSRDRNTCAQMVVCALAVDSPAAHTTTLATRATYLRIDGVSVLTPPSYVMAPELPPPRA